MKEIKMKQVYFDMYVKIFYLFIYFSESFNYVEKKEVNILLEQDNILITIHFILLKRNSIKHLR